MFSAARFSFCMRGDILALAHQLDAANSHIAQLEQQLANQPAPVPVTTPPPDPKATEALAALVELAKALSLLSSQTAAAA